MIYLCYSYSILMETVTSHTRHVHVSADLAGVLEAIQANQLDEAYSLLEEELEKNYEGTTITVLMKSVGFWQERFGEVAGIGNTYGQAEYLLSECRRFEHFLQEIGYYQENDERYVHSLRILVNSQTLRILRDIPADPLEKKGRVYALCARCYKNMGNYDKAIENYQQVIKVSPQLSSSIAELGDCSLLIGNAVAGKLLLREAFSVEPQAVDLDYLDSPFVGQLIERLGKELDTDSEKIIKLWLPVYADLWGEFDVKRELQAIEYGKLRQKIYALEREHSETPSDTSEPMLINAYLHLIDYYKNMGNRNKQIQELYVKLKSTNQRIYNQYIGKNKE